MNLSHPHLMPIIPDQPIVIPPSPGETFPAQWVYNLAIHAPAINEGSISIELLPFDPINHKLGPGSTVETIQTDRLWEALAAAPEAAAAMQQVLDAVPALKAWIAAQSQPAAAE